MSFALKPRLLLGLNIYEMSDESLELCRVSCQLADSRAWERWDPAGAEDSCIPGNFQSPPNSCFGRVEVGRCKNVLFLGFFWLVLGLSWALLPTICGGTSQYILLPPSRLGFAIFCKVVLEDFSSWILSL